MTIRRNLFSGLAVLALCGSAALGPEPLMGQECMGDFMFEAAQCDSHLQSRVRGPKRG